MTALKSAAIAAIAALTLFDVVAAEAADLGSRQAPAGTVIAMPADLWTGFYLGGHLGYGSGLSAWDYRETGTSVLRAAERGTMRGAFGGLQGGYIRQIGQLVLGLEVDASAGGISGRINNGDGDCSLFSAFVCQTRVNFLGTLRGRAGIAIDRALLYVTGGAALGNFRHREYDVAQPGVTIGRFNTTRIGAAVGAGLEYAVTANITVKVEYLYYNFGTALQMSGTGSGLAGTGLDSRTRNDLHTVRVGMNYLFSTGGALVARD